MVARKALSLLWAVPLLQFATVNYVTVAAAAPKSSWIAAEIVLKDKLLSLSETQSHRMVTDDYIEFAIKTFAEEMNISDSSQSEMAETKRQKNLRNSDTSRTLQAAEDLGVIPQTLEELKSAIGQLDIGGREIQAEVTQILAEVNSNREAFDQVAGETGRQLIAQAKGLQTRVEQAEQKISSLARELVASSGSILTSFGQLVPSEGDRTDIELDDVTAMRLVTAIRELLSAIDQYSDGAAQLFRPLQELSGSVRDILSTSIALEGRFNSASKSGSRELRAREKQLRDEAYGSCGGICAVTCAAAIAALFLQPVICGGCIGGCFGTAAGVIEGDKIPALQRDYAARAKAMLRFADIFQKLGARAEAASQRASDNQAALRGLRSAIEGNIAIFEVTGRNAVVAAALLDAVVDSARDIQTTAIALYQETK